MPGQRSTPGCGCALLAAIVAGSFLIAIYGGDIYFPFVLLVSAVALIGYIVYRFLRPP
jgi:CHASE2 domain-containing sensor protein